MKEKSEVKAENRAVFYAVLYPNFRKAALECGYALALHGSMARDMDLIAVAWTKDAKDPETLVKAISDCIGETVWSDHHFDNPELQPHGRITYTLSLMGDYFIDLSIIPPIENQQIIKSIDTRITELNEADSLFCKDRWDPLLTPNEKALARQMSNEVTFARKELQDIKRKVIS